ncbi:helix-turn-helix domain-containing protein [Vagococcus zengguangii]|uniref:Helix-turn-helix transcriptional regulator n=1 Tax=Vagococcus zengguangii TaxID=2571750 RepID=A0A4D7CRZ1_9ENTE|nr:helix-turn-helix transcriptional regulator [Vagococcus zengguangii]QCI86975.1 helix-turn-helix transcriptional regulator [Vagococcus zengguangii]TLG80982.1 helix-turn-helix transcriptional regulator [Vagococcus zengguangii]
MKIGSKIKEQRLKKGWTQEQLAGLLNVSRSAVSSWEVGRNYPDLEMIVALSDLFDISLDQMLREDTEMTKAVSKKIRMNKYYKVALIIIGILAMIYVGGNFKMRWAERDYRDNLTTLGWKIDENQVMANNAYILQEEGRTYWTYVMPTGLNGIPTEATKLMVITRQEISEGNDLVIGVYNDQKIELIIAKSNDSKVKYSGKLIVDDQLGNQKEGKELTTQKREYFESYIEEHKTEYLNMIQATLVKMKEIRQ